MAKKREEYYGEEQINFVVPLFRDDGLPVTTAVRKMCDKFNLPYNSTVERCYRYKISKLFPSDRPNSQESTDEFKVAQKRVYNAGKHRFIVTWAQAETPIHEQFFENIKTYADYIGADIHVICGRYKSPTSLESSKAQEKKEKNKSLWDARLLPYLDANRQNIHPFLSILGDVKIQPTASTPLSGLNGITGMESCIVGHPRVHLKCLPVLDGYPAKLLVSTGAVTKPNYTDTKAGKKGDFHHQLGFVVVELDGDVFHMRQVQCDSSGKFYDLLYCVDEGAVRQYDEACPAIIWGDLHLGHHNEYMVLESINMAKLFQAKMVVIHDAFDGKSISHHEMKDPFIQLQNEATGDGDLSAELSRLVTFFNGLPEFNFVAVRSNHDDFLDRWLVNSDWRKVPNRAAYLRLANLLASGVATKGVIPHILETECDNVNALGINDSCRVGTWELAIHGHLGQNGSRGSATQFKGLNTKNITGHTHQPIKEDGHMSVGTLTHLRVGYNNGASAWMNSNIIIYPNNKASHIHIMGGRWTTFI